MPRFAGTRATGSCSSRAVVAAAVLATLIGIVVPGSVVLLRGRHGAVLILYVAVSLLAIVMALSGRRLMIPWISRRASRLSGPR